MRADLRVLLENYSDQIANFSYRVARFDARHPDMKYTLTYEDSLYEEGDLDYDESVEPDEQEINPNWVHAELTFEKPEDAEIFSTEMGLSTPASDESQEG